MKIDVLATRIRRPATGLLAAALIGLGPSTVALAADLLPPPIAPGTTVTDRQIDAAISKVDAIATDVLKRSGVPGMAVVVVRDGKTVLAEGFGVRKAGAPAEVDADTVFQLASISKSISATVVARAVGDGLVTWNTPVVAHLPWFALSDPYVTGHVTIGDLFAHRSGLPGHAGDHLEDLGYDRRDVLERLKLMPLASFRDTYAYTNFGLTAAAESVAAAAGTDWASLAEKTLFAPLGMTTASYRFADFESHANRAVGHVKIDGRWQAKFQRDPDAQAPAGGVSLSVSDLGRWLAMVLQEGTFEGTEIVPAKALLPAIQTQVSSGAMPNPAARPGLYGYGFGTGVDASGRVALSHSGAFYLGAGTSFVALPLENVAIAVLTNATPTGAAEAVARTFVDLVEFGKPERDWYAAYAPRFAPMSAPVGELAGQSPPADPKPAPSSDTLIGSYRSAYFGDAVISETGGHLVLALGPKPITYELAHWDGPVFAFAPVSENTPVGSLSRLTFAGDGSGKAGALTIEYLNAEGLGTFQRK